jgi:UDP-N-acetylmuramate dehydrogenase
MLIQENVALAPLTTIKVGGPARFFVEATSTREVGEAVQYAESRNLPLFVLGEGSNLIISDEGWPGLVLKIAIRGINHRHGRGTAHFDVGAGEEWDGFVATAVAHHCSGVECLSGIPGSVGGTPVQNVGAYGQEVAETIESVAALDIRSGEEMEFDNTECGFAYRTSVFNSRARGRYIILRVTYALVPGGEPRLAYADLKTYFADWERKPTLSDAREAVRQIRASKSMLITPGDEDCRSAGSFFRNPILSADQFQELKRRARAQNLEIPSYPALDAQKKVSAAWLVEHAGFSKGYVHGPVGISRKHALAIVNRGGAAAAEIVAFKDEIERRVEEMWGIRLEPEPVFVGF